MTDKKRKFESEILSGRPLTLKKHPRNHEDDARIQTPAPSEKLVLPESRDLVLRLITKIKEH